MRSFRFGIVLVFASLAIMLSQFIPVASAATITVGSTVGIAGGKARVPVTLSGVGATNVGGIDFTISYDSQLLTLSSSILGPAAQNGTAIENKLVIGEYRVGIINFNGIPDGGLVNLTFDVTGGIGAQQIGLPLAIDLYFDVNGDALLPPAQAVSGFVSVIKAGDCDGSGSTSIAEVQSAVNMFMGSRASSACVDSSADGIVSIAEVQQVINRFLGL